MLQYPTYINLKSQTNTRGGAHHKHRQILKIRRDCSKNLLFNLSDLIILYYKGYVMCTKLLSVKIIECIKQAIYRLFTEITCTKILKSSLHHGRTIEYETALDGTSLKLFIDEHSQTYIGLNLEFSCFSVNKLLLDHLAGNSGLYS